MDLGTRRFGLRLLGSFCLFDPEGKRIRLTSRKSVALVAMLAMSRTGERERTWLQSHLWGSRAPEQAKASLRRELANLRLALKDCAPPVLIIDHARVRLDFGSVNVDVRELEQEVAAGRRGSALDYGELLEGIDIPGEEEFEDWLRVQRSAVADLVEHAKANAWERQALEGPASASPDPRPGESAVAFASGVDPPLPRKPSIAIIGLGSADDQPMDISILEATVDELSIAISRYATLFVVRAGVSPLSERHIDRRETCRALGVRYLLEASVRRSSDALRVTVRLVDGAAGEQLWADRFNGTPTDVFGLYDSIAATVAPQIDASIEQTERRRAVFSPVKTDDAYQLYWRANAIFRRFEKSAMIEAAGLAEQILEIEPDNAWAAALAGFCHSVAFALGWADDPEKTRKAALAHYERALRAGGDDPFVLGYAAGTLVGISGDMEVADRLIERALALHPNAPATLFWGGWVDIALGRAERALQRFELALRLNPRSAVRPHSMTGIGICLIFLGRHEEAVIVLTEAAQHLSHHAVTVAALALALKLLGRNPEAAVWTQRLEQLGGVEAVSSVIRDPAQRRALAEALKT